MRITDYKGKQLLYLNGFHGRSGPLTEFDELKCEYQRESPNYNPSFDFSIIGDNGLHVSTCTAFIDNVNKVAVIEKVCTREGYRRRGFSRAVIMECFKRLHSAGIDYAYICGYSTEAINLYGTLGAEKDIRWFGYKAKE